MAHRVGIRFLQCCEYLHISPDRCSAVATRSCVNYVLADLVTVRATDVAEYLLRKSLWENAVHWPGVYAPLNGHIV